MADIRFMSPMRVTPRTLLVTQPLLESRTSPTAAPAASPSRRRTHLAQLARTGVVVSSLLSAGVVLPGCSQLSEPCEIACFEFTHEAFDDAPDWLTVRHVEGRDLPAGEVYITNVLTESDPDGPWETGTVAWHAVDADLGPTDGIAGRDVRVDIGFPDVVQVRWRHDGTEAVLDETRDLR